MEKMVGFKDDRDLPVLNKLLGKLNKDKADARFILANRIKDVSLIKYTLNIDDVVIRTTTANAEVTLPKATSTGKVYWVKNSSGTNITLKPTGIDTIEGLPTMVFADKVCRQCVDIENGNWNVI